MGNYPDEERCLLWNTDAYHELAEYLKKKKDKKRTIVTDYGYVLKKR